MMGTSTSGKFIEKNDWAAGVWGSGPGMAIARVLLFMLLRRPLPGVEMGTIDRDDEVNRNKSSETISAHVRSDGSDRLLMRKVLV